MNTDETVDDRIARDVEQRNGCPRGCPWCAATAAQLAAIGCQPDPDGGWPR